MLELVYFILHPLYTLSILIHDYSGMNDLARLFEIYLLIKCFRDGADSIGSDLYGHWRSYSLCSPIHRNSSTQIGSRILLARLFGSLRCQYSPYFVLVSYLSLLPSHNGSAGSGSGLKLPC